MNYIWEADFSDASTLAQFDENGNEVKFGDVEARMDDLQVFRLVGDDGISDAYEVDLTTGLISHDGNVIDSEFAGKTALKLVYSRRNQVRVNSAGEKLSERTTHRVGLAKDSKDAVVEVFPGLEMAPASIKIKYKDDKTKNKDITQLIKDKEL